MHRIHALLPLLLLLGCVPAEEAPSEIGELTLFFFRDFEDQPALLVQGTENLESWVVDSGEIDLDAETYQGRRFAQPALTEDDLGGADKPAGFDPERQSHITVFYRSPHPLSDHESLTVEPDQTAWEPTSPNSYVRHFQSDTGCWIDHGCARLETTNDILKENILYTVPYSTVRVYRRFELSDGRTAVVSRLWSPEVGVSENGLNSIDQNFAVEFLWEAPDDPATTVRGQIVWTSATIGGEPVEINIDGILGDGIDDTYGAQDDWLDENPR